MLISKQIVEARELLASISIFEMPKGLVHTFAVVDCMLYGVTPVLSWATAISLVEDLHAGGCPKKAVLKDAQNLLIQAQMAAALGSLDVAAMADDEDLIGQKWTVPKHPKKSANTSPFVQGSKTVAPASQPAPAPQQEPTVLYSSKSPKCSVTSKDGKLIVQTPFNAAFVAALKTLPPYARKWDQSKSCWIVDEGHKDWVINLVQLHYSPAPAPAPSVSTTATPLF